MNSGPTLPPTFARVVTLLTPADRRADTLGDLEEVHRRRVDRLGARAATRLLWREVPGLAAWRLRTALHRARGLARRHTSPDALHHATTTTTRRTTMGRDLLQDLRFGARALWRRKGFAAAATGVLALGIGAPTTVFSMVDTIFFHQPEHVTEPHRLVRVYRAWTDGRSGGSLSNPDYQYYRQGATALTGLAAWGGTTAAAYAVGNGQPDQLDLTFASDNYFDVLGVPMAAGRAFRPDENRTPGTHPVLVIGHGFWTLAWGADPEAVGSTVSINGLPFTVIGVAPEGFAGVSPVEEVPDAWAPIAMYGAVNRETSTVWWKRLPDLRSSWLQSVGRLAPASTFATARANLMALSEQLAYDGRDETETLLVSRQILYRPSQEATLTNLSRMLLAAVALVLIVAMANVAVLLLSRASTRAREMGVRTALGAQRGRLVRQLLAESLILGTVGGALGVALAYRLSDLAGALLPLPFVVAFRPSPAVLAAAAGLALLTALVVGLAPALHTVRQDPARAVAGGRFRSAGGRLRHALVVGQVGVSVTLLAGAFLFAGSFRAAQSQPLGFDADRVLMVRVDARAVGYDEVQGRAFVDEALTRLRGLPGVAAASTSRQIPFQGDWSTDLPVEPGGPEDGPTFVLYLNAVSPQYFEVMGIPVRRGRPFASSDRPGDGTAVVINDAMAARYFPGVDPVGRTVDRGDRQAWRVVGVVADAAYLELGEEAKPQAYLALSQVWQPWVTFMVRTVGDPAALAPAVHRSLRELDPELAFGSTTTLASVVGDEVARYEVSAILVGAFGLVALLLAAAGLYGVVAFLVAERTREIGVRMALGADRGRVAGRVLGFAVRLAAAGVVVGLVGAVVLRRFTGSLVFGVSPTDPAPLLLSAVALLAVTALAAWAPARRATRVDPLEAMRAE
ncbi:MAG: ADOP family duplicated permease [Longimicrobiales bacterium]